MNLEFPDEVLIEGVARAVERLLLNDALVERVAEAIAQRFELLSPDEMAGVLGCKARTLFSNAKDWGLDKSVAFGASLPRYFLSQAVDRAQAKVIKGAVQKRGAVDLIAEELGRRYELKPRALPNEQWRAA